MARRSKNFQLVKALVPKLSPAERKELATLLRAGEDVNAGANAPAETCALYAVIQSHLHKLHGSKLAPFGLLPDKMAGKIRRLQEQLDSYLRRFVEGSGLRMSRGLKVKFYMLYCEVVSAAIIKNPEVPLSLSTLVSWKDRFLGLLDDAYPGYSYSGMIPLVMESLVKR